MTKYEKLVVGEMQTNCYLIWSDKKTGIIIDPGDEGVEIAQRINELKIKPVAILLTHGHFDHILGAIDLKMIFNIPIAMNKDDIFLTEKAAESASYFLKKKVNTIKIKDGGVDNIKSLRFDTDEIEVINTPGHTPGSVCFYYKKYGWLFSGDTIFAEGLVGDTNHLYSSDLMLSESISKLMKLPASTVVLPGHGEATTIEKLKIFYGN